MSNRGSSGVIGYDDFLSHSSGGGGGTFLKQWRDAGSVDVWTHPRAGTGVRWAHSFWELKKFKKRGKGNEEQEVQELSSYRWICHEREAILRRQRFRNDDINLVPRGWPEADAKAAWAKGMNLVGNGTREYPPEHCPMCLMIEWVRDGVRSGRLDWTKPLFTWKLDGNEGDEVVTIGGFCGLFGRPTNDYKGEQLDALRRAGIERDEAFMQNATARCDYILRVVDDSDPGAGCVIAPVADALGRLVQKAFKDRIEQTKGAFKPSERPLCLRWKYDEDKDFDKKYEIVILTEAKPSDEVLDALEDEPPPIDNLLEPGNAATLRAQMEQHCAIEGVPWEQFFGAAQDAEAEAPGDEPWDKEKRAADQSRTTAADTRTTATATTQVLAQVPAQAPAPAPRRQPDPPPPQAPANGQMDAYDCEVCNADCSVPAGSPPPTRCPTCGSEYDPETGAVAFDATKPVGAGNMPRPDPAAAQAPAQSAAEQPPPAGREPARRRRQKTA